jgi:hypothetical protein
MQARVQGSVFTAINESCIPKPLLTVSNFPQDVHEYKGKFDPHVGEIQGSH